jgi:hypothetical protein
MVYEEDMSSLVTPFSLIAALLVIAGFLLGFLFHPGFGGSRLLRNVGGPLPNYTALQPRSHLFENFRFNGTGV